MPTARMNPEITAAAKPSAIATQVGHVLARRRSRCSHIFAKTTEGAGKMTGLVCSARTAASHNPKNAAKTNAWPTQSDILPFSIVRSFRYRRGRRVDAGGYAG